MSLPLLWAILLGGFLGSIPFGLVIARLSGGADPRISGSGNIGATNVARTGGWWRGVLTLLGDALKGSLAVALAPGLGGDPAGGPSLGAAAAVAAVLGHMFSPFMGFRGGKGVATGLGVFAVLMPGPVLWSFAVFLGTVLGTRYVSLGSILGSVTLPVAGILAGYPAGTILTSILVTAMIVWRHEENIRRLIRGEENRIHLKKPDTQGTS